MDASKVRLHSAAEEVPDRERDEQRNDCSPDDVAEWPLAGNATRVSWRTKRRESSGLLHREGDRDRQNDCGRDGVAH